MNGHSGYRLIEHTADMGIEAQARTRTGVLVAMARGLKALMYADSPAKEQVATVFTLEAADPVELLVAWLSEIVSWCDREDLVPATFAITRLDDRHLEGAVSGEPFNPHRHQVERQVKAVTYHQACCEANREGWYARVYVDL